MVREMYKLRWINAILRESRLRLFVIRSYAWHEISRGRARELFIGLPFEKESRLTSVRVRIVHPNGNN